MAECGAVKDGGGRVDEGIGTDGIREEGEPWDGRETT